MATMQVNGSAGDLKSPVRNRYYYGKLLDVRHFELEQEYFNMKRALINQRVLGAGVVCGLDVILAQDGRSVSVQPGLALDRCGKEILVTCPTSPISLDPWLKSAPPATPPGTTVGTTAGGNATSTPDDGKWVHLCICFHECETDPEPAFGGDCDTDARCASGAIRERYKIDICEGKVKMPQAKCNLSELFSNNTLDYAALARFVSRPISRTSDACCIPLANIQFPPPQTQTQQPGAPPPTPQPSTPIVDITVRPVVFANPLLFQLMLCLCGSNSQTPCGGTSY